MTKTAKGAVDKPRQSRGRGRPTKYKAEYAEQARKLCLLGLTNEELAQYFEVGSTTLDRWISTHADFRGALKAGKRIADAEVAAKLHERAMGYRWTEQQAIKIRVDQYKDEVEIVEIEKEVPPDPTSMIFWLKNRDPERWRDKPDPVDGDAAPTPVNVVFKVEDASSPDRHRGDAE